MKKIFYIISLIGFLAACFLNKKYGWRLGDKIADKIQSAADFVAEKLEKTRGNIDENTTSDSASS